MISRILVDLFFAVAQLTNCYIARWVGRVFITQPDWNVPEIFRNRVAARMLVIGPQVAFLALVISAFYFVRHPWWYLFSSIAVFILVASPPYRE